jgi:hypothetical protein
MNMRSFYAWLVFLACLSFALYGCLNSNGASFFFDLDTGTGEIRYLDIVSNAKTEDGITGDFRDLIHSYLLGDQLEKGYESIDIHAKELYTANGNLNGIIRFSFSDPEQALSEFDIMIEPDGTYVFELSSDMAYTDGNGILIENDAARQIRWDNDVKKIKMSFLFNGSDGNTGVSLNPHWLEWKKNN